MVFQNSVRVLTLASLLGVAACGDLTQTQQRTLTGGAGGAAVGAGVGAIAGNAGLGALIGGGLGTAAGYLFGVSNQTPQAEQAKAVLAAANQSMDTGAGTTIQAPGSDGQLHRIVFRPVVRDTLAGFMGQSPAAVAGYGGRVCGQIMVEVSTLRGQIEDRSVRQMCRGSSMFGSGAWGFI